MDDELAKIIFGTKEVELRSGIKNKGDNEKLDGDSSLKDTFEIKFKDSNGRTIFHRAAL